MKFWKRLNFLIAEMLPDWRDKFLLYKDLKKQLKLIYPKEGEVSGSESVNRPNKRPRLSGETVGGDCCQETAVGDCTVACRGESEERVAKDVIDFGKLLEDEVKKFNTFFVDKEEDYIIRLKVLRDRVAEAKDSAYELMKVGREIVDFHGEMVLLENYSALNYTGLVKILKKYDKRSGALLRLPFIQKVLDEPFFKTDVLNTLVEECEMMLKQLFSVKERSAPSAAIGREEGCDMETANEKGQLKVPGEIAEIENIESTYLKLAQSALQVLQDIRSGSSTVSMFSLPPLRSKELEEVWKKAPILEQAAK